jgi:hypothetical protein
MSGAAYTHLHPEMREIADLPDEQRIARVRAERWISNPVAVAVLDLLQEVKEQPRRERMENLLLVAESGMGKTMLIRKFERANASDARAHGVRHMPVVAVLMPPEPTERAFFEQVLRAVGARTDTETYSNLLVARYDTACMILEGVGAKVLVIDEINSVLVGSPRQQRLFLQLLRFMSNELGIALVCTGVPEARHALLSDTQLRSRFFEHEMPLWVAGPDLQVFANRIIQGLPLRSPSEVVSSRLCRILAERTGGITLYIRRVFERAAVEAIRSGRECITPVDLEAEVVWRGIRQVARAPTTRRSQPAPS